MQAQLQKEEIQPLLTSRLRPPERTHIYTTLLTQEPANTPQPTSASYAIFRASKAARMLSRSPAHNSSSPAAKAVPPGPTKFPLAFSHEEPPCRVLLLLLAGLSKARRGTSRRTTRSRRLLPKSSHSFSNTFLQGIDQADSRHGLWNKQDTVTLQCCWCCWCFKPAGCHSTHFAPLSPASSSKGRTYRMSHSLPTLPPPQSFSMSAVTRLMWARVVLLYSCTSAVDTCTCTRLGLHAVECLHSKFGGGCAPGCCPRPAATLQHLPTLDGI